MKKSLEILREIVNTETIRFPRLKCTDKACWLLESANEQDYLYMLKNAILATSGYSVNKIWYRTFAMKDAVKKAQDKVKAMAMFGEFNHKSMKLNLPPDPEKLTHVITKLETRPIPKNVVRKLKDMGVYAYKAPEKEFVIVVGDVVILPTPAGQIVKGILDSGAAVSFSLRARPVKTKPASGGFIEVHEMELVSFDVVAEGGFKEVVRNTKERMRTITYSELERMSKLGDPVRQLISMFVPPDS